MSREEAMNALIESGMDLRRDDIELGKKLERERIIKLLENHRISLKDISAENWVGLWHDAVKKIKDSKSE